MKTRIEDWQAFHAVAVARSFSAAAKGLGISASMLTKKISRLEAVLGLRLFQRSTRKVALTREGEQFLPALQNAFTALDLLERTGSTNDDSLAGSIRITAPAVFSQRILPKILTKFLKKYPKISIELIAGDQTLSLIEDHIDLAIRTAPLRDSSLVARKLCRNEIIACATPRYLANSPSLKSIGDLKNHRLLFMDVHQKLRFRGTRFTLENFSEQRQVKCAEGATLTQFALAHGGVAIRSKWDVEPLLASGELVPVLKNNSIEDADEAWLYLPSRKNLPRRIRLLVDYLIVELQ